MEVEHAFVSHDRRVGIRDPQPISPGSNAERGEKEPFFGVAPAVRQGFVDVGALGEELSELFTILGQRTPLLLDPLPRRVDVDFDQGDEGGAGKPLLRRLGECCPAAQRNDRGRTGQRLCDDLLLDAAEFRLAPLEELADRPEPLLDLLVRVDERALGQPRELLAELRLAGAHEADQGEVLVYRADHGMRSR